MAVGDLNIGSKLWVQISPDSPSKRINSFPPFLTLSHPNLSLKLFQVEVLTSSSLLKSVRQCWEGRKPQFKPLGNWDWGWGQGEEEEEWHPTPVLLPGKSHGRRSLVGCSPWGRWGSDTTEQFHFHFSLSRIGEGNGNPLQCSCLENPRDGGASWAAVSGVTQSQTRLKWLSSSSSSSRRRNWSSKERDDGYTSN